MKHNVEIMNVTALGLIFTMTSGDCVTRWTKDEKHVFVCVRDLFELYGQWALTRNTCVKAEDGSYFEHLTKESLGSLALGVLLDQQLANNQNDQNLAKKTATLMEHLKKIAKLISVDSNELLELARKEDAKVFAEPQLTI